MSLMEGKEDALYALTYRRQMTGDLGYPKHVGYDLWHIYAEQALRPFGPSHEAEKALQQIVFVKYRLDITKFLLEMQNLNINARVTGIA